MQLSVSHESNQTINPTRNGMNVKSFHILCAFIMRTGYCSR